MSRLITQEIKDNITQDIKNNCASNIVEFNVDRVSFVIDGTTHYYFGNSGNDIFDFKVLEKFMEILEELENNSTKQIMYLEHENQKIRKIAEYLIRGETLEEDFKVNFIIYLYNGGGGNIWVNYKNGEIFDYTPPKYPKKSFKKEIHK